MSTDVVDFPLDKINQLLDQVELAPGHHDDGQQACAMDLIGMAVEGEWKDTLDCVHPVLSGAVHRINDHQDTTPEDRRSLVLDAGPLLLGTAGKPPVWACLVRHKGGLTAAGFVAALKSTPETDLRHANLRSANLSSADLRSADLRSANLRSADLRSADLSSADLSSADLSSADLRSADLRSATYTQRTLWPEGFDVAASEATEVDPYGRRVQS